MQEYDLFVSYRRKNADRVLPLVAALRERGLRVWFDQSEIQEFAAITDTIRRGLADSKAFLAWYSADYPKSRPCQMELTAAFIAAQQAGDVRQRVLLVNPEPDARHVLPIELADEQHLPGDEPGHLATRISERVRSLRGTLGAIVPSFLPPQYGRKLVAANRFVGRLPDLWRLHSALHGRESAIISGSYGPGLALLSGLGGGGKSMVAEEYALRFAAAYPGGIFWLRALGNDGTRATLSPDEQETVRQEQVRNLAIELGIPGHGLEPRELEAALARKLSQTDPFLWVVDDVPSGLEADTLRRWLAPASPGKTLVTTRSREYGAVGIPVPLGMLEPHEAVALLTAHRTPQGAAEEAAARGLAADLGFHPLGLEVAGAWVKAQEGLRTFAQVRADLANPDADELEFAADPQIVGMLPTGHESSVATTLMRSIRTLGPEGRDVLRLASVLAVAPIPTRLVAQTLRNIGTSDESHARHRVGLALAQVDRASLATRVEDDAVAVHALVSRTMRFSDDDRTRTRAIRAAVVYTLNQIVPAVADVRQHADIALEVLHARELVRSDIEDAATTALALWVAQHDFERGAFEAARLLQEQVLGVYRRGLGEEHLHTLATMNNLAQSLWALGNVASARHLQEQVLNVRRRVQGDEHPDTLAAMNNLAGSLSAQGDLAGARVLQERVLDACRRLLGADHPNTLMALANLAGSLSAQGDVAGSRQLLEQALAASRRVLGEEHPGTLIAMANLAESHGAQGDVAGARRLQEQVLATRRQVLGAEHPDTLTAMINLAGSLSAQGDVAGARVLQERVVGLCRRVLGDGHPYTIKAMNNLGQSLSAQGDMAGARVLQEQVLAIFRQTLGDEHPHTLTAMNNRAGSLVDQGDVTGARQLLDQVLGVRRRVQGDEHPDTLTAMNNLAGSLRDVSDVIGARQLLEQVVATRRRVQGDEHPDTLTAMGNLALSLSAQRDVAGARRLQEQVLAVRRRVQGDEHPDTLTAMGNLAASLWQMRDVVGARRLQEQVVAVRRRVQGDAHHDTLTAMNNLAASLWQMRDVVGARALLEQVVALSRRVLGDTHPDTLAAMANLAVLRRAKGGRGRDAGA